jgi:hypothetical protein
VRYEITRIIWPEGFRSPEAGANSTEWIWPNLSRSFTSTAGIMAHTFLLINYLYHIDLKEKKILGILANRNCDYSPANTINKSGII